MSSSSVLPLVGLVRGRCGVGPLPLPLRGLTGQPCLARGERFTLPGVFLAAVAFADGPHTAPPSVSGQRASQHRRVQPAPGDRKSTRLNSSHVAISYAVFCLTKKNDECTDLSCH